MVENEKACPNCGEIVIKTARFCPRCGQVYPPIEQVELTHKVEELEQTVHQKRELLDRMTRLAEQSRTSSVWAFVLFAVAVFIIILVKHMTGPVFILICCMAVAAIILLFRSSALERKAYGKRSFFRREQQLQRKQLEDELAAAEEALSELRQQLDQFTGGQGG